MTKKVNQYESILLAGQLRTSRTETIEQYLLDNNIPELSTIGVMSPFANYNESRVTKYINGKKTDETGLPCYSVKKVNKWNYLLITFSFLVYLFSFIKAQLFLKKKHELFIGVAAFSAVIGVIFKKLGLVDKVVFYCLDYYPPQKVFVHEMVAKIIRRLDVFLVKNVDYLWEISPKIKDARERYAGLDKNTYKSITVPLGYHEGNYPFVPPKEREQWTLGFLGSLSENQGLQMVIESLPKLIKKFPEIKLRVVGHGYYRQELDALVEKLKLKDRVIFHGFIRNDEEVNNILSRCAVGLATWTGEENDNSLYADPGKPKLYALIGLPIIITSAPWVSSLIEETGAGVRIEYNQEDFIKAVSSILETPDNLDKYISNLENFKPYCLSVPIFDRAFLEH